MPQGRRKIPFSGKAKKEQLKSKKLMKESECEASTSNKVPLLHEVESGADTYFSKIHSIHHQPSKDNKSKVNRYTLKFRRESEEEIKKRKEIAYQTLETISEDKLNINSEEYYDPKLDFPKRPQWSFHETKEQLELKETIYFSEYLKSIENTYNINDISYFELNLETWRQFWRVLEMSDVILLITDIRFCSLQFPPSLYHYVRDVLKKDLILVLNKVDLVPAPVVAAWKSYFEAKYTSLHIVMFSNFTISSFANTSKDVTSTQRRGPRKVYNTTSTRMLFHVCKDIVNNDVDLASWQDKLNEEDASVEDEDTELKIDNVEVNQMDTSYWKHQKFKNQVLTIGCVGYPNVGKSTVINAIMGKKVVSVSKTPGHTKHFQTIFITPTLKLCDCPGLVFPSKLPQALQVLMGSYPIAQLREPFTIVKYLAERIDLIRFLRIEHPEKDEYWSAMDICEAWAKKKGYFTAKASRPDTYRAANHLLRITLDGKISFYLRPPFYSEQKDHPDIPNIELIQGILHDEKQTAASFSGRGRTRGDISAPSSEDEANPCMHFVENKFSALDTSE